jgi:hypothetical protein
MPDGKVVTSFFVWLALAKGGIENLATPFAYMAVDTSPLACEWAFPRARSACLFAQPKQRITSVYSHTHLCQEGLLIVLYAY